MSGKGKTNKKNMNSGLKLQISRVHRVLKRDLKKKRMSKKGSVYLTGVTEYVLEKVLEGAKECLDNDNTKKDGSPKDEKNRRQRLSYKDVAHAICDDEDLKRFFADADFRTTVFEPKLSLCVKLSANAYKRIIEDTCINKNITAEKLRKEARFCGLKTDEKNKKGYAQALLKHHYPDLCKAIHKKVEYENIAKGNVDRNISKDQLELEARSCGLKPDENNKKGYAQALLEHHYPKSTAKKKPTKKNKT